MVKFEKPTMDVIVLSEVDVIATSNCTEDNWVQCNYGNTTPGY